MFNKNASVGKDGIETVIGPSVKIEGNFVCQGGIVIEGEVKGIVKTAGFLEVGEGASVIADVGAKEAKIGGEVRGNVKIDGYMEVTSSARLFGDIEAAFVSIARGAVIKGKCSILGSETKISKSNGKQKEELDQDNNE
ncbi:MAG: polymer-forming cytoskeletal protein [Candidatus Falkowbacteria bacterium]|nr:polymer-forming cytoskeletal protein [Candidatus Falkowbacteria bacterium]